MPASFTQSLAQRLNERSAVTIREATDGDRLERGLVLLAPGDYHLRLEGLRRVALDQGPPRDRVRPAVDVTMESAATHYRSAVIGVVHTGMGSDGAEGSKKIRAAGGKVIVEDESTCVVHGMPRSVAEAGQADRVAPLPKVASALMEMLG